jgi:hypothetical protein
MRINNQGQYRLRSGKKTWHPLANLVRKNGPLFARRVVCFKTNAAQLPATLLAVWQADYTDPWLILTDLPVHQACIVCHGMRSRVECGFKDFKRGGWRWDQSKMTEPARAERLWLVMSVATIWVLSVGGEADAISSSSGLSALPQPRPLSCFVLGLNLSSLPLCLLFPYPLVAFFLIIGLSLMLC